MEKGVLAGRLYRKLQRGEFGVQLYAETRTVRPITAFVRKDLLCVRRHLHAMRIVPIDRSYRGAEMDLVLKDKERIRPLYHLRSRPHALDWRGGKEAYPQQCSTDGHRQSDRAKLFTRKGKREFRKCMGGTYG